MMHTHRTLFAAGIVLLSVCGCSRSGEQNSSGSVEVKHTGAASGADLYFDFTVDGNAVHVDAADVSTSYHEFSPGVGVFKVYAGKEGGTQLALTIPGDLSKPLSVPSGSKTPGDEIFQGSVSLQGFPKHGLTFNNYDGFIDPKPEPVADAIVVTASEKVGEEGRIISGTIKTTTVGDAASSDPELKPYAVAGKFRVKHKFLGEKF